MTDENKTVAVPNPIDKALDKKPTPEKKPQDKYILFTKIIPAIVSLLFLLGGLIIFEPTLETNLTQILVNITSLTTTTLFIHGRCSSG